MEILIYAVLGFGLGLFGGWLASFRKFRRMMQFIEDETGFLIDQIRVLQNNQIKLNEIADELGVDISDKQFEESYLYARED